MIFAEILHKIRNAKHLDFGQIFNESIELFKKMWVHGLVTVLLTIGVMVVLVMVVFIPLSIFGIIGENNPYVFDDLAPLMLLLMLVLYLLMILCLTVVAIGFKAALYRIMFQYDMDLSIKEDYFYFLKRRYLGKTITLALAFIGINLLAILMCYLPLFYVMIPLNMLIVIYAFNPDLSLSNLIKLSFELGHKKWFLIFGLTLVAGMIAQLIGIFMCFIGIFATASFVSVPLYFIYKKVIGFEAPEYTQIEGRSSI